MDTRCGGNTKKEQMKLFLYDLQLFVCILCIFFMVFDDGKEQMHPSIRKAHRYATCFCLGLCAAYVVREIRKEP